MEASVVGNRSTGIHNEIQSCIDVNECEQGSPCDATLDCINTEVRHFLCNLRSQFTLVLNQLDIL